MGYDISAFADENENQETITDFHTYMGAFRMLREQGYDWFELIDASECDGGVSGLGFGKYISLQNLENATNILKNYDPKDKQTSEGRDEFTYRKPILLKFMQICIEWIKNHNKNEIYIYFG